MVTITNSSFSENQDMSADGLNVLSNGAIILNNLTVNRNGNNGAFLNNSEPSPFPQSITVINSTFNSNGENGLEIKQIEISL